MMMTKFLGTAHRARTVSRKGKVLAMVLVISALVLGTRMIATAIQQPDKNVKAKKISFLIKTVGDKEHRHKAKFKVGEKIVIEMLAKNDAEEEASLLFTDPLFQYRFQLLKGKDQVIVPLRSDVRDLVAARENEPGAGRRLATDPVPPSGFQPLGTLDLQDWYGQLEPGKYKLTVQYRPNTEGDRFNSNTVTFEVVP